MIAVSPHPDDAVLSVGGLLGSRPGAVVVTVFSQSRFAPQRRDVHGDQEAVTALRRAEDRRYCDSIGAELVDVGLPDCTVRWDRREDWWRTDGALCGEHDRVVGVLAELHRRLPSFVVAAPLGIGGHPDHLAARDAARSAVPSTRLVFYEDMPYAASMPDDEIARMAASLGADWSIEVEAGTATAAAAKHYPSQVRAAELEAAREMRRRRGEDVERLWAARTP